MYYNQFLLHLIVAWGLWLKLPLHRYLYESFEKVNENSLVHLFQKIVFCLRNRHSCLDPMLEDVVLLSHKFSYFVYDFPVLFCLLSFLAFAFLFSYQRKWNFFENLLLDKMFYLDYLKIGKWLGALQLRVLLSLSHFPVLVLLQQFLVLVLLQQFFVLVLFQQFLVLVLSLQSIFYSSSSTTSQSKG